MSQSLVEHMCSHQMSSPLRMGGYRVLLVYTMGLGTQEYCANVQNRPKTADKAHTALVGADCLSRQA